MRKIKILWVAEAATVDTGFGIVGANVLPYLHNSGKYEIAQLGLAYHGDPEASSKFPFPIIPYKGGDEDRFGQASLPGLAENFNPDIVLSFGDIWMIDWVVNRQKNPMNGDVMWAFPQEIRERFKWVAMVPIDGDPMPIEWMQTFEKADLTIVPSHFGKQQIVNYNGSLPVKVIYHGVDCSVFKPASEEIREEGRRLLNLPEDKKDAFVIGIVGRNQRRKLYPQLFRALKEVLKTHPNVYCYCHALKKDQGWDLPKLAEQIGVSKNIILNGDINRPDKGIPREDLAKFYAAMDLFVLPTFGEGFGVPILEAMSCGIPVITSNYSAASELVKRSMAGELANELDYLFWDGDNNIRRPMVSHKDLASKIVKMIDDPELRRSYGEKGREFALKNTWETIAKQFDEAFTNLIYPEPGSMSHVIEI